MKGLKALQAYKSQQQGVNVYADEYLAIIEKSLKALEILKPLLSVVDYRGTYYLVINEQGIQIDREKYELLEEVLM